MHASGVTPVALHTVSACQCVESGSGRIPAGSTILTERQRRILAFIVEYQAEHGSAPTMREIGRAFGIRSVNGVNDHLYALERKGYIERRAMLSRSIRVLRSPDGLGEVRR